MVQQRRRETGSHAALSPCEGGFRPKKSRLIICVPLCSAFSPLLIPCFIESALCVSTFPNIALSA